MRIRILQATSLALVGLVMMTMWKEQAWSQAASPTGDPPQDISSKKIEGILVKIEGRYYVVKDAKGKEMRLLISHDTELGGTFQPGDKIAAWTSPVEHAMAIRAVSPEPEPPEAASQVVRGTLLKIEGKYYVIVDHRGKEIYLLVSKDTELTGQFRPGDRIEERGPRNFGQCDKW